MPCAPCWLDGPNLCVKARHAPMLRTEQTARRYRMAAKLKNQEQAGQPAASLLPRLQGQRAAPSCPDAAPPKSTGEPDRHFYASQGNSQPDLLISHAPPVSKLFRLCSVKTTEVQESSAILHGGKNCLSGSTKRIKRFGCASGKIRPRRAFALSADFFQHFRHCPPPPDVSTNLHVFCKF